MKEKRDSSDSGPAWPGPSLLSSVLSIPACPSAPSLPAAPHLTLALWKAVPHVAPATPELQGQGSSLRPKDWPGRPASPPP